MTGGGLMGGTAGGTAGGTGGVFIPPVYQTGEGAAIEPGLDGVNGPLGGFIDAPVKGSRNGSCSASSRPSRASSRRVWTFFASCSSRRVLESENVALTRKTMPIARNPRFHGSSGSAAIPTAMPAEANAKAIFTCATQAAECAVLGVSEFMFVVMDSP